MGRVRLDHGELVLASNRTYDPAGHAPVQHAQGRADHQHFGSDVDVGNGTQPQRLVPLERRPGANEGEIVLLRNSLDLTTYGFLAVDAQLHA